MNKKRTEECKQADNLQAKHGNYLGTVTRRPVSLWSSEPVGSPPWFSGRWICSSVLQKKKKTTKPPRRVVLRPSKKKRKSNFGLKPENGIFFVKTQKTIWIWTRRSGQNAKIWREIRRNSLVGSFFSFFFQSPLPLPRFFFSSLFCSSLLSSLFSLFPIFH